MLNATPRDNENKFVTGKAGESGNRNPTTLVFSSHGAEGPLVPTLFVQTSLSRIPTLMNEGTSGLVRRSPNSNSMKDSISQTQNP